VDDASTGDITASSHSGSFGIQNFLDDGGGGIRYVSNRVISNLGHSISGLSIMCPQAITATTYLF
jgi:hypothetical protein